MKLKDKVAITTGGASGIGYAIALGLANEGANIVIADIDVESGKNAVTEIQALKRKALFVKADVTSRDDVKQMVKAAMNEFGTVDILINNAGGGARDKRSVFADEADEMTDVIIDRNLKSVMNCTKAVIRHMIEKRSGKIVNIASTCGIIGMPDEATFSACKAGIIIFTKALAAEVGRYNINVNCVSPGGIDTPNGRKTRGVPTGNMKFKMGQPEDVARVVTLLVADEASFTNGQNYPITGVSGMTG